jgi:hypothetical protein
MIARCLHHQGQGDPPLWTLDLLPWESFLRLVSGPDASAAAPSAPSTETP